MQALETRALTGIIDLTPGIRSLQIHYQPETLSLEALLETVAGLWQYVCGQASLDVPSRVVWLPLSDDPACQKAIDKYMTTVRRDAPWCPSNPSLSVVSTIWRISMRSIKRCSTPAIW